MKTLWTNSELKPGVKCASCEKDSALHTAVISRLLYATFAHGKIFSIPFREGKVPCTLKINAASFVMYR